MSRSKAHKIKHAARRAYSRETRRHQAEVLKRVTARIVQGTVNEVKLEELGQKLNGPFFSMLAAKWAFGVVPCSSPDDFSVIKLSNITA